MYGLKRFLLAVVLILLSYFTLSAVKNHLDPNTDHKSAEDAEDALWIATSKYWLDRQACRWVGLCGLAHFHPDPAGKRRRWHRELKRTIIPKVEAPEGRIWPDIYEGDRINLQKGVPQYVLDYAPLVHLYSGEEFWPSDLDEHLKHLVPSENETAIPLTKVKRTVGDLHEINNETSARLLFLKSQDDVEDRPAWLGSKWNKPVPYPEEEEEEIESWSDPYAVRPTTSSSHHIIADPRLISSPSSPSQDFLRSQPELRRAKRGTGKQDDKSDLPGYSAAAAHLVLLEKPNNITDAFWFYFYSYNLGPQPLNIRFGNHVGDWEHSLVRFQNGVPKAIFCSAHSGGLAYAYKAVEKGGKDLKRPVLYSAMGSHAMYATPGRHPYILPFGILADVTDKGPLWDPSLNYKAFWYNTSITHDADAQSLPAFPSANSTGNIPDTLELPAESPASNSSLHVAESSVIPLNTLIPAKDNPDAAVSWFHYRGRWGDKFYTLADWRQWRFVGQYHYVNAPFGPRYKNLGRSLVCQSGGQSGCTILEELDSKKSWLGK
ncbi:hypothetical protein BP6252_04508 [Coleophoma cylindrospora]|uniref:Uncharacterized protein n=1 Tax=Coleophoma cylindrospora TaxID=1849047 RepID=A0A3D8S155_9HELO|nr:hypothetical protein BP6252_04508 [Coleophoma cylindrospora]